MNIHHLELFYYVARHGGITEAVRNIPYGIQQPAVSGQVAQLEAYLGVQLFQRRPFALTSPGAKLYHFIEPFFSGLEVVSAELQGGQERQIRLGASVVVLREHMPAFLRNIQKRFPQLRVTLREGAPATLQKLLEEEELDIAVTIMEKKPVPALHSQELIELPLALVVNHSSPIKKPEDLWKQDRIKEPLICLPPTEHISKHFQQGLARLGVDWFTSIEVTSLDLIETYAANGFGVGISVQLPQSLPPGVRVLPLNRQDFAPLKIGAFWRGKMSPVLQAFLNDIQLAAKRLSPP